MYQREQIIRLVCANVSVRVAAGTEADITKSLPKFEQAVKDFSDKITIGRDSGLQGDSRFLKHTLIQSWVTMIFQGLVLVDGILSTRSIPKQSMKAFEMAYRTISNSNGAKQPADVYKWFDTNQKRLSLIIEAAKNWPPKQEGSEDLFNVGSFRVHNTVGAQGAELDSLRKAIEKVEFLSRKNPIHLFSKAVYGDIHVVARITKAHHAAWYFEQDDSLYLRRSKTTGMDEVFNMIHELGHRYWSKFALEDTKKQWVRHHRRMENNSVDLELPSVGDPLPVKISGTKELPLITKIEHGRFYYELTVGGKLHSGAIPIMTMYKFLEDQQRKLRFPTTYSTKSAEEHFCEALALSAMGTLKPEHQIPFDAIWNA